MNPMDATDHAMRPNARNGTRRALPGSAEEEAVGRLVEVTDVGAEHVAEGVRVRVERVERAARKLAEAQAVTSPLPSLGTVREVWDDLTISERNHVLRRSLSAIWVRRGRGPDRIKLADRTGGTGLSVQGSAAVPVTLDWDAPLDGELEIGGPTTQEAGETRREIVA